MLLQIPALLDTAQLDSVRQYLAQADFVHGKATAGKTAAAVKHNLELDRAAPMRAKLIEAVMSTLLDNPIFQAAAYPAKVSTPIFARYTEGMGYGDHVDDPVMGETDARYRSDVSLTLFLNDPSDYAGGAVVVAAPRRDGHLGRAAGDGDLAAEPSAGGGATSAAVRPLAGAGDIVGGGAGR
jgi:PKHD-type hydroxylase